MPIFSNPEPMNREAICTIFSSGTKSEICEALLSMALYDANWKWSQDQCLNFLDDSNLNVRCLAALCLGHIARIHGHLDRELVVKALKKHLHDEDMSGTIQDALDDIQMFLGQ